MILPEKAVLKKAVIQMFALALEEIDTDLQQSKDQKNFQD
jgi:hypothetical protein